jgi:hypothetical protein
MVKFDEACRAASEQKCLSSIDGRNEICLTSRDLVSSRSSVAGAAGVFQTCQNVSSPPPPLSLPPLPPSVLPSPKPKGKAEAEAEHFDTNGAFHCTPVEQLPQDEFATLSAQKCVNVTGVICIHEGIIKRHSHILFGTLSGASGYVRVQSLGTTSG